MSYSPVPREIIPYHYLLRQHTHRRIVPYMEKTDFTKRDEVMDLMRNDPEAFFNMVDMIKAEEAERQSELATDEAHVETAHDAEVPQPQLSPQARSKAMRIAFRR